MHGYVDRTPGVPLARGAHDPHATGRLATPALLLFFVSGATGLVYETIWLRELVLVFGSTLYATSAILSTFMGGLALGAWLAGRAMERLRVPPLRAYGLVEIALGGYALLVPALLDLLTPVVGVLWRAGGSDSFFWLSVGKLAGIGAVLLPPTVLMGATLPVLARQVARREEAIGGEVGALYAANTLGAVAGTALAGFVLLPALGMTATLRATAGANAAIGALALLLSWRVPRPTPPVAGPAGPGAPASPRERGSWRVLWVFAASGFVAMVLEVAWTRGLVLVVGSSVYAFSLMLIAFLAGLALGSAAFAALLRRRRPDPRTMLVGLLGGAGLLAFSTGWVMQAMPGLFGRILLSAPLGPEAWFGVQLLVALLVMFPTTFLLGGIFPAVLQAHARRLDRVPSSVGRVYAANTLGTILGAVAGGFLLVPWLGVGDTVVLAAAVELGLALLVAWKLSPGEARRRLALAAPFTAGLALVAVARPGWDVLLMNSGVYMNLHDLPEGRTWQDFLRGLRKNNRVVYHREGLTASVLVADHLPSKSRYLSVNGKIDASSHADLETQVLLAHLPLLFHERPQDVLVIGLASGITIGSVATHPVRRIGVIEVERAMLDAARLFTEANGGVLADPRVRVRINDARNELRFDPGAYDVIISEPSNPWMTVASNLFTEEFFRLARTRLRPGGIFCQWVQAYCLRPEDLRSILAAFREAFPCVLVFETLRGVDLLAIGTEEPVRFDLAALETRMTELRVQMDLRRVGVRRAADLLALFRLGDLEARRLLAGATSNTDDNGRVEFAAPRAFYLDTIDANLALLDSAGSDPLAYLDPPPATGEEADRLSLALALRWKERGHTERAAAAARRLRPGSLGAEAGRLLLPAAGP